MNEEFLKRNTDCVYFLASPLTCKKGIECEYRHNEIARLNPRECWYWLSGSCLNQDCVFRHPPLDGHTGETLELAPSSVPGNKTNVPCYYYFNGYCNKGDRCSFLHDMDAEPPQGKKLIKPSVNSEAVLVENNNLAETKPGSALANEFLNPSITTMKEDNAKDQPKVDFQMPVLKDVPCLSSSLISVDDETTAISPYSSLPAAGFIPHISYAPEDYSSEEQLYDQIGEEDIYSDRIERDIELEDRWESSSGFDVLVDGEAGNLDSEAGEEYIMAFDRKGELNGRFSGYDFENPVDYGPSNPDIEFNYASDVYHQHVDVFDDVKNVPGQSRVRTFDSISFQDRKRMPVNLGFDDRKGSDLRYHLSRRKFIGNHSFSGLSRMHKSSQLIGRSEERPWRYNIHRKLHRKKPVSEQYMVESVVKNEIYANGGRQNVFPRPSKHFLFKNQHKEKKPTKRKRLSSEVSRERRPTNNPTAFSGPKTLAQIKEEKRIAQENTDLAGTIGHSSRRTTTSADFKGPKPLSEILKDKGKL